MELSDSLKKRFCSNYNIPIKIYQEPYFSSRIELFDEFFDTKAKLEEFITDVNKYDNEQHYFHVDKAILQNIIDDIRSNDDYKYFNEKLDMNKFKSIYSFPSSDIWKDNNVGRTVISIDLRKANFQCLKYYSKNIFNGFDTWENYLQTFTKDPSKIHSKHYRQVVFGSLNPRRQTTYQKYLMEKILCALIKKFHDIDFNKIVLSLSNDEIVLDFSSFEIDNNMFREKFFYTVSAEIKKVCDNLNLDCHVELFKIKKLAKDAYFKEYLYDCEKSNPLKKVNHFMMPFVIRKILNQEVQEEDKVFYNEGYLCKFIDNPLKNIETEVCFKN